MTTYVTSWAGDRKPEGLGEGKDREGQSLGALVTPRT